MRKLKYFRTVCYYDGPQVVELHDYYGGSYIGVAIDSNCERYVATGVSPASLQGFCEGVTDLRSLMLEFGSFEWYMSVGDVNWQVDSTFELQNSSLTESEYLPEAGFTTHVPPCVGNLIAESRRRNNLVLDITVTPPVVSREHTIGAETLATLLLYTQKLVKHAYGAAKRELSYAARQRLESSDAHLLNVYVPAAVGSFQVKLEAAKPTDLIGQSEVSRALVRIDALFADARTPKLILERLKENRGHLAAAYSRFLKFLDENKMGFQYSWAEPNFESPKTFAVSRAEVAVLVDMLAGIANLGSEDVTLEGILEKADDRGSWRLANKEGTYAGGKKESGPSFQGLRIGALYQFSCVEEIEEYESTGREKRTLYLLEYKLI